MATKKISSEADLPRIFTLRKVRVGLVSDVAGPYGVTTKRLNEGVRRNLEKLPSDFSFVLTPQELVDLRSQFATSKGR